MHRIIREKHKALRIKAKWIQDIKNDIPLDDWNTIVNFNCLNAQTWTPGWDSYIIGARELILSMQD